MLSRLPKPGHATVVAYLALFVALGGSSYAAIQITGSNVRNSTLTGDDVKDSSLTGDDVRQGSLSGADVRQSSLTGSDVKQSSLTGADVRDGSLKALDFAAGELPKGDPGPPGTKGDTGTAGATNVTVVTAEAFVTNGGQNSGLATCPAGQRATGGGVGSGSANTVSITQSGPVDSQLNFDLTDTGDVPVGWFGRAQSNNAGDDTIYVFAICAAP